MSIKSSFSRAKSVNRFAALGLAAASCVVPLLCSAQTNSPSGPLLNTWLRKQSPQFSTWDIGGNVRAMYDAKNDAGSFPDAAPDRDFIRKGQDNDNAYFLMREKIHIGYNQDWVNLYIEGRDSSTTGDDRNPNPFADSMDLHQAYVRIGNPASFPLSLKIGRQQMTYGDERWVEPADWSNVERTFDAIKLRYEAPDFWVDAFTSHYVIPDDGRFNESNTHDLFSGLYASTRTLIPKQETELYFFSRNVDDRSPSMVTSTGTGATARDIYTIGMRVKSLPGQFRGWDYGAEIAGQLGSFSLGGQRLDQEALAADVMGGYTWANAFGSPRLGLDYTYASGDSDSKDGSHQTFDPLFGAAHKFYGIMDVTGLRNIHNPSVSLTVKPLKKLTLRTDFLMFWLADTHDLSYAEVGKGRTANGYGIHPNYSSYVGSEIDLIANYTVTSFLSFQAGYSHFFVGDYIKQSVDAVPANGGAVDADYVYALAKFNF